MQKFFLLRRLDFICSRTSSFNYKTHSLVSFDFRKYCSSKSESSSENPNSYYSEDEIQNENTANEEDVSSAELRTQIDKFYKGDIEAIPTIFESILKRKLAGKHEESDDELMNEFRQDQPSEVSDEVFDSDTDSDSDSEE
ncbi:uncharacterized protein LOC112525860 [Cynara cardunculus var. scolymus]|uniref:Uncharacterized protein n=1 Tax=Cynara cardunculus var. scolymus TaxID=59895 RepID=A0A103Y8I5_CYNCS|nr:uncharacterized protein LOC112525860 [Cynara cardunculus var. scolymus]KVI04479.1 hypothetical protein Ccrd_017205 [Cynara cardunculus var. scolymus]